MIKAFIGLLLALAIGAVCRLSGIPAPAPPVLAGAVLVLAMTCGYLLTARVADHRPARTETFCGGPTGRPASGEVDHGR